MDQRGKREKPRIVVDASIAVKWVIPGEPDETQANIVRDSISSGEVYAMAPLLLLYEVSSSLYKAVLKGILQSADLNEALAAIGNLGIDAKATAWDDLSQIVSIASETKLTTYDSTYLQLSRSTGYALVTADEKLAQKGEALAKVVLLRNFSPT